jgi:hypothetical protein
MSTSAAIGNRAPVMQHQSREGRMKTVGVIFAVAVCGVLAGGPAFAQQDGQKAGSDSAGDVSRHDGAAPAGSGTADTVKSGSDSGRTGSAPAGSGGTTGRETGAFGNGSSRKGLDSIATIPRGKGGAPDHGIDLIRPDSGYAGLRRRAERQLLIANTAKKPPTGPLANVGGHPQGWQPGVDGSIVRNAVGALVPNGAAAGVGGPHHWPGYMANAGGGKTGEGVSGIAGSGVAATAIGTTGVGAMGMELHRPPVFHTTIAGTPIYNAGINGTSLGHVGAGPGSIGGPAKDHSGINGTGYRPVR